VNKGETSMKKTALILVLILVAAGLWGQTTRRIQHPVGTDIIITTENGETIKVEIEGYASYQIVYHSERNQWGILAKGLFMENNTEMVIPYVSKQEAVAFLNSLWFYWDTEGWGFE
jgi:hypothetical protein